MHWCTVSRKTPKGDTMTTLDEREQQTLSKRCKKCGEAKMLEEFPTHKGMRDGRDPRCRVCEAQRQRERRWARQGVPPEQWPRLHEEADRRAEARTKRPTERQRI